ncbi:MAG TPA: glycosyltransferase family 39 protein, partial [Aggregatilineales bacterium]|nr:glycosyltransferase family 39 protein [Aggregatilineales bacterium]
MAVTSVIDEKLIQDQPHAVEEEASVAAQSAPSVIVSLELIVYIVLLLFALTARLPELGTIPLSDGEAHEALAALRALGTSPGLTPTIAHNPLMFAANTVTMAIFGNDTATARLPTVLVGLLIIALLMLFRRWFGRANTLIAAALLTISPVLLLASRTMSGSVWALALAILAAYGIGRYVESWRVPYALAAATTCLFLVFMAEPGGFITFLGLAGGL